jgi:O-antigen/teichoic acid export membrane protein
LGIKWLIIGYLITASIEMLTLVIMSNIAIKNLDLITWWKASFSSLKGKYQQMAGFLVFTNGNALFRLFQRNADILFIGYLFTPTQVGYFRLARSLADLISFPTKPFYTAGYPEFVKLWHQEKLPELKRLVRKLSVSQASIVLLALCFLLLWGPMIIQLTVGEAYMPSLPALYLLALGVAIGGCTNFGHPLLLAVGQVSRSTMAIAVGVSVQMVLLFILTPMMGITGAGIAYIGFYLIWAAIIILSIRIIWQN